MHENDFSLPSSIRFTPAAASSEAKLHVLVVNSPQGRRDIGVDLEVVSTSTTGSGVSDALIKYKLHDQQFYLPPITLTTAGNGVGVGSGSAVELQSKGEGVGVYIYMDLPGTDADEDVAAGDHYVFNVSQNSGVSFTPSQPGSAHQYAECSNRGACDRVHGTCTCDVGFTGDSCQRNACPLDCSFRGTCTPLKQVVEAAGYSYSGAFDAEATMVCVCDPGYSGHACQDQACPSAADVAGGVGGAGTLPVTAGAGEGIARPCSGRGTCHTPSGTCMCDRGFMGSACNERTTFV